MMSYEDKETYLRLVLYYRPTLITKRHINQYTAQICARKYISLTATSVLMSLFFLKIVRMLTLICLRCPALRRWHLFWREAMPPSPPRHVPPQQAGARHFCSTH